MKWYFVVNEWSLGWFDSMVRVAVLSAKEHTTLEPHCLYDGQPNALTRWLEHQGVTMHVHRVSFAEEMAQPRCVDANAGTSFDPETACGYYLALDVPLVEAEDDYVLFTDVDVIFQGPVELGRLRPAYFAAAPEVISLEAVYPELSGNSFNSGVLLLNVEAMRSCYDRVVEALRSHDFFMFPEVNSWYDQGVLNYVFQERWDLLPAAFNWRAYWRTNGAARIIHLHGPKPQQLINFLRDPQGGSPTEREYVLRRLLSYQPHLKTFARYKGLATIGAS